jgi:hypothetical protein
VPQIWMTYDELATMLGTDPSMARAIAARMMLDRRKSRDGRTRAKLSATLSEIFLDKLARHWVARRMDDWPRDPFATHTRLPVVASSTRQPPPL